jgi:DNA-directed RNA polymerase subunit M/transcription elongation factor TFIIS
MNRVPHSNLIEDGYQCQTPTQAIAQTEDDLAREATCPKCAHQGMTYYSYYRKFPLSYRVFHRCPICGYVEEQ